MRKTSIARRAIATCAVPLALAAYSVSAEPSPAGVARPTPTPTQKETVAETQDERLRGIGRTATTGSGEVGTRQTRRDTETGIDPMARLATRVQNRVQNRLRNRVDENYQATANATDPFDVANQVTRVEPRPQSRPRR